MPFFQLTLNFGGKKLSSRSLHFSSYCTFAPAAKKRLNEFFARQNTRVELPSKLKSHLSKTSKVRFRFNIRIVSETLRSFESFWYSLMFSYPRSLKNISSDYDFIPFLQEILFDLSRLLHKLIFSYPMLLIWIIVKE